MKQPVLKLTFKLNDLPKHSTITSPEISYQVDFMNFSKLSVFPEMLRGLAATFRNVNFKDLVYLGEDPVVRIYPSSHKKRCHFDDYLIADIDDFYLELVNDSVVATVQNVVAYTFENLSIEYVIEFSSRRAEVQRPSLIREVETENDFIPRINILLRHNSKVIKHEYIKSLADFIKDSYCDFIINYQFDGVDVEISFDDLKRNELRRLDINDRLPLLNFMSFKIGAKKVAPPLDKALSLSFDAELRPNGKIEKLRLLSYIKMLNRIKKTLYIPIINVCQSSGCGKSKLAKELMADNASVYIVFRESGSSVGYPNSSFISELFNVQDRNDSDDTESVMARFALILKAILSDYFDILSGLVKKRRNTLKEAFKKISDMLFKGTFIGHELEILREADTLVSINSEATTILDPATSIKDSITACNSHISQIKKLVESFRARGDGSAPLIFILDEASLLASRYFSNGLNHFRLLRRILSKLDPNNNLVALTLGTNSDVFDLNSQPTVDSFREDKTVGLLVPPFILARNWDIFLDKKEMKDLQIGYQSLLCGRLIIFRFSLGRPVWSSVSFDRLIEFSRTKITNNSLATGQAYLAFWMVRIGIQVNPVNVVCKHLVKSLMAHVKYISDDVRCLRVDYPSEPALAIGARDQLRVNGQLLKYYENLENFIASRAVDKGRMSEVISADICLQALDSAEAVKIDKWDFDENLLPRICRKNNFILELDLNKDKDNLASSSFSSQLEKYFSSQHRVVTVKSFLNRLFGSRLSPRIIKYLPNSLLSALISTSHFNQMIRQFPFSELNVEEFTIPSAQIDYIGNEPCNVITNELLMTGIMRECSYLLPQNYFGLDYIIPICLKPVYSMTDDSRPEYSYIGSQVKKRDVGSIRAVVSKCALSNHFVRCARHLDCKEANCNIRVPDVTYKKMIQNGLVFIHVLESESDTQNVCIRPVVTVQLRSSLTHKSREESMEYIKTLCPASIFDEIKKKVCIDTTDNDLIYKDSRFIPDLYICLDFGGNVRIHFMAKKHSSKLKLIERLTAIETRGLKVFENVLPAQVARVAKRIIDNDFSIFDELKRPHNSIQYKELVQNVNYCNNSAVTPMADNILRHRINLPPIPDEITNYDDIHMHADINLL